MEQNVLSERHIHNLDVVIPCHNEQEVVTTTHQRLTQILSDLVARQKISSYTLVFVDNGSTDGTLPLLLKLFNQDPHTTVITLRNNFKFQGSISAGLYHSKGDAAITIDADLQDPPENIEAMIEKYAEGFDLVLGVREDRKTDSFFKKTTAHWYYTLLRFLGVHIVPHHGDFRLMSKELVALFNQLPERNRFIRAMVLQLDANYATVQYQREPRRGGYSKFSLSSLISLGLDGITSHSYSPLRIAGVMGFIFFLLSFLCVGFVLYTKWTNDRVPGWASILCFLLFFSGIQLFFLGMIGEYIGKIYKEIKQRPLFVVRKKYSHPKP
jgi:polyisoprenyl-phosphate glycosyltransferase